MANSTTLPQGFSVFQPALGSQLQFFPAVGSRELDELVNAYVSGPASVQEKRASISLDFLEYAHLTGQTFKFYPVYSVATPVVSPATASPLQDSGYGSSFNASPVMSNWDWSQANAAAPSRRQSPKATSRHQTSDFSHLPGMKIMTRDGLDVTNSASRGSKTKEQRDHAHLMRIIKACDSCRRKKIRCDPSHKKAQPTSKVTKVTKKTKTVAREARTSPVAAQPEVPASIAFPDVQSLSTPELDSLLGIVPAENVAWEDFIQYPPVDEYDFFNDPEGYFSPQSSSLSAYSTKPVTPTSQQDQLGPYNAGNAEATVPAVDLPFNQTESAHNYVDFNLFSPESSFSEDERMVSIEGPKQSVSQPRSPVPVPLPPAEPAGGSESRGVDLGGDLGAQSALDWATAQQLFGDGDMALEQPYRDPGAAGLQWYSSPSSSLDSDVLSHSLSSLETSVSSVYTPDLQSSSAGHMSPAGSNVAISHNRIIRPSDATLQSATPFANVSQSSASAIGTSGLSRTATGHSDYSDVSDYYDHNDHNDHTDRTDHQDRRDRRNDATTQASDASSCHVLTEHQHVAEGDVNHSSALNSGSPVSQNRRRDVLEPAPSTGAALEIETANATSTTQAQSQTRRAQTAAGQKEDMPASSVLFGIAPVSTVLASLLLPSYLATFTPIVMMLVALAAWFSVSSVGMGSVDKKTRSPFGDASSMSQACRLLTSIGGKIHGDMNQRAAMSGTKSVGRMASSSRCLIAV